MSRLILCENIAKNPLYVKGESIRLFSVEELNYYIYNNIYTIGPDFFDMEFLSFVENEINQEIMAKKIKDLMFRKESYLNIMKTVIECSDYYSEAEKKEFNDKIYSLSCMSYEERMKERGDILAEKGKLNEAYDIYRKILSGNILDDKVKACVKNNVGVIYARMFKYDMALRYFCEAYDIEKVQEYLDNIICSILFMKSDKEAYLKSVSMLGEKYEVKEDVLGKYKEAIEAAEEYIRDVPEVRKSMELLSFDGKKEIDAYYEGVANLLEMWKKTYREDYNGIVFE